MIRINIQGMESYERQIDQTIPTRDIDGLPEEFKSEIKLEGTLKSVSNRFYLNLLIKAIAELECDISLDRYDESIEAPLALSFHANNELYDLKNPDIEESDDNIIIREDLSSLDITRRVIEVLTVSLPMKRIAPAHRDKDISDLYPNYVEGKEDIIEEKIDSIWNKLKDLKIN